MTALRVLIVGRGRLGLALGSALRRGGARVTSWSGRGPWPSRTPRLDGVVIAVADPFIAHVAADLAPRLGASCPVLHASGARGTEVLASLAPRPLGAMHPLVSFASPRAPTLAGATVIVAGDAGAVRIARRIARALSLRVLARPLHGPRYHAAAALVANGAVALAAFAVRSLETSGLSHRAAERAIGALLRSVADNVASLGVPAALTGPIVRGDSATVHAHRAALDERTLRAYDAVAPLILEVARDAGLSTAGARAIERALTTGGSRRRSRAR